MSERGQVLNGHETTKIEKKNEKSFVDVPRQSTTNDNEDDDDGCRVEHKVSVRYGQRLFDCVSVCVCVGAVSLYSWLSIW